MYKSQTAELNLPEWTLSSKSVTNTSTIRVTSEVRVHIHIYFYYIILVFGWISSVCSSVTQVQLCFEIFETILKNYIELWKFFSLQHQPRNPQTTYIFCTNWIRGWLTALVWNCLKLFWHLLLILPWQILSAALLPLPIFFQGYPVKGEGSGTLSVACFLHKSDTSVALLCKKHIIDRARWIFSPVSEVFHPAGETGSKATETQRGILQTVISLSSFVCFKKQVLIVEKPDRWCWQLAHRQTERERKKGRRK